MIKELFINMNILITFIFVIGQIYRNKPLTRNAPFKIRCLIGMAGGILGCILMIFSIHIEDSIILDLRHIAIVLSALHGGVIPSIICGLIISIFRILYFGINTSSVIAALNMLCISLVCGIILKAKMSEWKNWVLMNIYALGMITTSLFFIIKHKEDMIFIFLNYWAISTFAAGFVYYLVWYVKTCNDMFRRFKEQSLKDFLTGLNNVREFDLTLNELTNKAKKNQQRISILIIDIDYFKKVNDTYGHHGGDLVLMELGRVLCSSCNVEDVISRMGGEEFSILLLNCSYNRALEVGERIRKNVENHKFALSEDMSINITVSIGVATYPDTVDDVAQLLKKADDALYKAKEDGRNKVCTCI